MAEKVYATVAIEEEVREGPLRDKAESLLMDALDRGGADIATATMSMYQCKNDCGTSYTTTDHWHWTAVADLR